MKLRILPVIQSFRVRSLLHYVFRQRTKKARTRAVVSTALFGRFNPLKRQSESIAIVSKKLVICVGDALKQPLSQAQANQEMSVLELLPH